MTIRDVSISGLNRLAADTIRTRLTLSAGQRFDAAKANESVKALFAMGQFEDVRIGLEGATLKVVVVEAPVVRRVSFEGNAEVTTQTLESAIKLKANAPYSDARAHQDAVDIRNLYRRQGRLDTTVSPRAERREDGTVDLVFRLSESRIEKVSEIRFSGNHGLSASELRSVVRTVESSWLDILKSDAFYDPDRLETDRELLLAHYRKNGYADAKIVSATGQLDGRGTGYVVTYTIDEGERYAFAGVAVESRISGLETDRLSILILTKNGAPYNSALLDKSVKKLSASLLESGHPFASVRALETRAGAARVVNVTYRIEEVQHTYVERVEIMGNARTKDIVIRRELRFAEGDAVHPLLVERARERIKALGFFKSVKLTQKQGSSGDKVVISVEVVEDDTAIVGFGAGYSQNDGVVGDVSYEERNLMGNGQWVKIKLAGGLKRLDADIGFTEPHFLGSNVSTGADAFYKDQNKLAESSYKSRKAGGDVRLGYGLSEHWSGQVKYMLTRSELYDVGSNASTAIQEALQGSADGSSNTYYTSALGFSATYDDRDSKRFPTAGTIVTLGQDFAGLGGDVRYLRSSADLRTYYPVSEQVTLAARIQGGTIAGWGGQDVRLLDMFYRGGDLVRGFASSGLGPRDLASTNQDALGGTSYFGTSLAGQFDLPLVPKEIGLRGEVFADAGSLFGLNKTAQSLPGVAGGAAKVRASVGAGLVWDSPIGPLRADYAVPVISQSFDKTQPLSFGIGQF
ncbi:MAG: outer membrane protein assembly factor BamA [Hyphomicrobium sp.]